MRLFVAVQPFPLVLDHLEMALTLAWDLREEPSLRWAPPGDRHITLAFYGEVPEGYLDDLVLALDDVAAAQSQFDASLRGAGMFDGRVLWIGCSGSGWAPLMTAAGQVGTEVLGRTADGRSRPHLTVARVTGRSKEAWPGHRAKADRIGTPGDPVALVHALAVYAGPTWAVAEIALISSHPGAGPGGGPRYDVVHRSPLAAVAG